MHECACFRTLEHIVVYLLSEIHERKKSTSAGSSIEAPTDDDQVTSAHAEGSELLQDPHVQHDWHCGYKFEPSNFVKGYSTQTWVSLQNWMNQKSDEVMPFCWCIKNIFFGSSVHLHAEQPKLFGIGLSY